MFEEIYQAAFNDELQKIALNVGSRVIKRGERHQEELSEPISTGTRKSSLPGRASSSSSSGFKLKFKSSSALGNSLSKTATKAPALMSIKRVLSSAIDKREAKILQDIGADVAKSKLKKKERRY